MVNKRDKFFQSGTTAREGQFLMTGPCSAESPEQLHAIASGLKANSVPVGLFRAGLWKPRTRPGSFEGLGEAGLSLLIEIREKYGFPVTTEVARTSHVEAALKAGVDVVWVGARTTVSPFSVQEIADALRGSSVPVIVKNPINPDIKLWLGAVERLMKSGMEDIAVIHRGFSYFNGGRYRNNPMWQIPIGFKLEFPDIPMLCDISHICGSTKLLGEVAQQAMDLRFDGLMVEVHHAPGQALSDREQQITPQQLRELLDKLILRRGSIDDLPMKESIAYLRNRIDRLDEQMLDLLAKRMQFVEEIGLLKEEFEIPILQPERWHNILRRALSRAEKQGLSSEFIEVLFKAIHQESIDHQTAVMNKNIQTGKDMPDLSQ